MKVIDLEAHFVTEEYLEYLRTRREVPKLETVEDERHEKSEQTLVRPRSIFTAQNYP